NTFEKTNTGTILDLTGTNFNYNPSRVASAVFKVQPRTEQGVEGMLYDLTEDTGDQTVKQASKWFTIRNTNGGQIFDDQSLSSQSAQILCKQNTAPGFHGFIEEAASETTYRGIIFTPFTAHYTLQAICAQGDATMKGLTERPVPAGHRQAGGLIVALNTTENNEKITLKSFIDKIESEEVCFVPKENGVELRWFAEKILEAGS
ncbi:MAG: hypothetical protein JRE40_13470, partial [Deltaproteobacteria bacterium]|nr:hypothetical protein [Deltaproteobacteria bacterium]